MVTDVSGRHIGPILKSKPKTNAGNAETSVTIFQPMPPNDSEKLQLHRGRKPEI